MNIADRIQYLRKQKGYSQEELADMIACKDREIMDGERWVLVSLSTDEAKRLLKYLEEHIAK